MEKVKAFFKKVFTKENLKAFFFSFVWLGVLVFVADIVSKWMIVKALKDNPAEVMVIKDFFSICFITNDGAAFSLGSDMRIFWIIVSILLSAALIVYYIKKFKTLTRWMRVSFILMIAGALGNLIDRCFYWENTVGFSGVIDWIWLNIPIIDSTRFNIADASLVVGVGILLVIIIVDLVKEALNKTDKENAQLKLKNDQQKPDENEKSPAIPGQNEEENK